jgi:hypothetical protein
LLEGLDNGIRISVRGRKKESRSFVIGRARQQVSCKNDAKQGI